MQLEEVHKVMAQIKLAKESTLKWQEEVRKMPETYSANIQKNENEFNNLKAQTLRLEEENKFMRADFIEKEKKYLDDIKTLRSEIEVLKRRPESVASETTTSMTNVGSSSSPLIAPTIVARLPVIKTEKDNTNDDDLVWK
ncbi:hypothetical protein HDE_10143 [Halotydeus destructor]|nr:hypothetical protein HDE_10143 [Halotydeus destructor]